MAYRTNELANALRSYDPERLLAIAPIDPIAYKPDDHLGRDTVMRLGCNVKIKDVIAQLDHIDKTNGYSDFVQLSIDGGNHVEYIDKLMLQFLLSNKDDTIPSRVEQFSLVDLIKVLNKMDGEDVLPIGPVYPHSYRGDYDHLAFCTGKNIKVSNLLYDAGRCIGRMFDGWKGGLYRMYEDTPVWIVNGVGETGDSLGYFIWKFMTGENVGIHSW